MKYMGSKARIAKYILPIILSNRKEGQWYVEPFCGGCNTLDKVTGNRVGCDSNEYLIALFDAVRDNDLSFLPDAISEDEYNYIKDNQNTLPKKQVAFCGFNATFGAKWFGGYARPRKNGYNRDVICGKNELIRQQPLLAGVTFLCKSYLDLKLNKPCIIYCDPPYEGTTKYKDKFNHAELWAWCRRMKAEGHTIFISEYNAPDDFKCVWQKEITNSLSLKDALKPVEKLFTI